MSGIRRATDPVAPNLAADEYRTVGRFAARGLGADAGAKERDLPAERLPANTIRRAPCL
jgi:hypothetical protein